MDINPRKICQVCNTKANQYRNHSQHYGAICCNNCRSFFRRTIQLHGSENLSTTYTVKTLITAAALIIFSHNFGQNLLSKKLTLLWLLFKCGSYLSAALINVIKVFATMLEDLLFIFTSKFWQICHQNTILTK